MFASVIALLPVFIAKASQDLVVDKQDQFINRALKAWPIDQTSLDGTALAKVGHVVAPPPTPTEVVHMTPMRRVAAPLSIALSPASTAPRYQVNEMGQLAGVLQEKPKTKSFLSEEVVRAPVVKPPLMVGNLLKDKQNRPKIAPSGAGAAPVSKKKQASGAIDVPTPLSYAIIAGIVASPVAAIVGDIALGLESPPVDEKTSKKRR